ncbi:hypothetical protein [Citrobacter freundii]|uniref:hypothetical protein n=1 Tax=Citrobacter freundii TaxID=546 RepID=UPI003D6D6D2F
MGSGKTIKKIITKIFKDDLISGKVMKVNEYTYEYKPKPDYLTKSTQGISEIK